MITKKQSIGLWVIVGIVVLVLAIYLLKGVLHEPIRPDQSDSLEVLISIKKQNAASNKKSAEYEKQKSDEILNRPVDSTFRDSLFARIEREAKADSIARSLDRQRGKARNN